MSGTPTFRLLTRQDLPTLHAWVQRPHVAEWWPEPRTIVEIEHDYMPCVTGESSTRAYIAMVAGEPIGFKQLFQDPAVTKVQVDPSPRNERAIRSYRRAGFVAQGEITTPGGPALLMIRHRTNIRNLSRHAQAPHPI